MNEETAVSIDPRDGIEHLISRMAGTNRGDNLIVLNRLTQTMINEDIANEKREIANGKLAAKERASALRQRERDAKGLGPVAPRKARTPKVPTTTKHNVKAKGTGTVHSAA